MANHSKNRANTKGIMVRVVCLALAALMIFSVVLAAVLN